jgi:hypothetical protein
MEHVMNICELAHAVCQTCGTRVCDACYAMEHEHENANTNDDIMTVKRCA